MEKEWYILIGVTVGATLTFVFGWLKAWIDHKRQVAEDDRKYERQQQAEERKMRRLKLEELLSSTLAWVAFCDDFGVEAAKIFTGADDKREAVHQYAALRKSTHVHIAKIQMLQRVYAPEGTNENALKLFEATADILKLLINELSKSEMDSAPVIEKLRIVVSVTMNFAEQISKEIEQRA